ncbi:ATP-binding protein [Prescottella sp. R16]|uniref:sensor histidine kinase n=1 Tax=Prescottella sp. R16 TaxID=3064529 RepID=UPI00272E50CD|nr:ATP-binding protein [Prescottella sp. R16]
MTETTPPARRPWNLEGWGVRWKITAAVAIPLTVAMVLGGLRVQSELANAVHYGRAADQVADVPAIVKMGTDFGLASAGYSVNTLMPEDLEGLAGSIDAVRDVVADSALPSDVVDRLRTSLTTIEGVQQEMVTGAPPRADLADQTTAIRQDLTELLDDIVGPIEDPAVIAAHTHLIDAWSAQRRLADQVTGAMALLANPNASMTDVLTASGAELAVIDSLIRSFPAAAGQLDTLRQAVHARLDMFDAARGGPLPLLGLRASLVESVETYSALVAEASDAISATVTARAEETRSAAIRDALLVLVTLLAALVLALLVSRSLIGPIRRLRLGALRVAREDLPDAIDRVMDGDLDAVTRFEPVPVYTTEEIGQLARAVDDIHGQALRLAGEQADLRLQIGDMFETLARRSKSLVDQQLGLIENLEFEEKDPKRLESLFKLDHLAARMRRNGDNLLILSGHRVHRAHSAPVQLGDTVRAAMSEVEDYRRVQVGSTPNGALSGTVAADVVHLVAELLDNALQASPPDSKVRIAFARAVDGGVLIEISDSGIGVPPDRLAAINERLGAGGEVSPETARHMGLFVVSRLAARHGLTVRLRRTHDTRSNPGITASVHLPDTLLVSPLEMVHTGPLPRMDTDGMPVVTVVPSGAMPQLVTTPAPAAPESAPSPAGTLPQRTLGGTAGLPQRTPGATSLARMQDAPAPGPVPSAPPTPQPQQPVAPSLPALSTAASPAPAADAVDPGDDSPPARRHRYRSNAAKTASFFGARPNTSTVRDDTDAVPGGTPIFSDMVTDWLTDPTEAEDIGRFEWVSAGDEGWAAAHRVSETPVEDRTESGLPQRRPGHRLVPGGVDTGSGGHGPTTRPRLRDPEAVRENLSRHQKGTRLGRAASAAERTSIGGDR